MLANPPWAGPTVELVRGPEILLNRGTLVDEQEIAPPYEMRLVVDPKADDPQQFPPLDMHGPGRHLIFSQRMIDILNAAGIENIQYFPTSVVYDPTNLTLNYQVANVVGLVRGLDEDKSELIVKRERIFRIKKIAFDESKFGEFKFFRLAEKSSLIVVHASIKQALEDNGMTGIMFISDEQWKPGMI
jgi:hypothetical protein